jgi:hypothetical protein
VIKKNEEELISVLTLFRTQITGIYNSIAGNKALRRKAGNTLFMGLPTM